MSISSAEMDLGGEKTSQILLSGFTTLLPQDAELLALKIDWCD